MKREIDFRKSFHFSLKFCYGREDRVRCTEIKFSRFFYLKFLFLCDDSICHGFDDSISFNVVANKSKVDMMEMVCVGTFL